MKKKILIVLALLVLAAAGFLIPTIWFKPWSIDLDDQVRGQRFLLHDYPVNQLFWGPREKIIIPLSQGRRDRHRGTVLAGSAAVPPARGTSPPAVERSSEPGTPSPGPVGRRRSQHVGGQGKNPVCA